MDQPELPIFGDIDAKWDAADILAHLREKLAPDQANLLTALIEAMNDHSTISQLNTLPLWRDQPPVMLDESWPAL